MTLSTLQRVRLQLIGHVYVGDRRRDGWSGPLPHYAFRCPIHGLVEDYPHDYKERLECPICRGTQCNYHEDCPDYDFGTNHCTLSKCKEVPRP
ncbi:MAG: hypothetical protein V1924_06355 [Candidatus Bathyarchaeota archaeon]